MTTENTDTNDDPVETDGGVTNADAEVAGTEESTTRSLGELPLSRRTTLSLTTALGLSTLTAGTAAATDINATDPARELVAPGSSTRALELALSSSDQVIDISGGTLPGDGGRLGDGDSTTPTLGVDSDEAPALYDTVADGVAGSPYRHPQPDPGQEVIPGDLLSEFSVFDRVFTDAYAGFEADDASIFNRGADSLYQAAGKVGTLSGVEQATYNGDATPYVEQFVPFGYTASDGPSRGCVDLSDGTPANRAVQDGVVVDPSTGNSIAEVLTFTILTPSGDTEIDTIELDVTDGSNGNFDGSNDRVAVDGEVLGSGNVSPGDPVELDVSSLGLTFDDLSAPEFEILLGDSTGTSFSASDLGDVRFLDSSSEVLATDVPTPVSLPSSGANLALPKPGALFSTDIAEIINPQLAVKVDSIGVGQDEITGSGTTLPYTAQDVVGGDASPEAILVDEDGVVPERFADPDVRPFGIEVSYDAAADQVTISYADHRQLITLANAGWIAGVSSCSRPRGDRSPCDPFECVDSSADHPVAEEYVTDFESYDGVYGRSNTTAGVRDTSQLGLSEEFGSNPANGDFLAVSVDVDERNAGMRDGPATGIDERPHVLVDEFYEDDGELEANTATVDVVSALDIPDMAGVELERLAETANASEQFTNVATDTSRTGSGSTIDAMDNGFIQVPLDPDQSPDFLLQPGDPLRIDSVYGFRNSHIIPRGQTSAQDAIGDMATGQATEDGNDALLSEAEAYRELDFDGLRATLADGDDGSSSNIRAAILSGANFLAPVQVLVEGAFTCDNGTPIGDVLNASGLPDNPDGDTATVDITHSDRVTFAIEDASDDSTTVDANGVVSPGSIDAGSTITVGVYFDGCQEDTVEIVVLDGSTAQNIDGLSDFQIKDLTEAGDLLDDLPSGERVQSVFTAEYSGTNSSGNRLDLTHLVDADGNADRVVFSDQNDPIATPTAANDGIVDMGTPRAIDDETVTAELSDAVLPGAASPVSGSADQTYQVNNDYFLAAVARPCRNDADGPGGNEPGVFNMADGDAIILVTTEPISSGDGADTTTVHDADLQTPEAIRAALEEDINAQTRDQVSVSAFFNPAGHSANGYVVVSDHEVASSFDQDVAHSSVEIDNFSDHVDLIESDYDYTATLNGACAAPSEGVVTDYLERQDAATALGFGGAFNQVDAATVENDTAGFVEPSLTSLAEDVAADRYAARCDPLDEVDYQSINRFLGDNELTCNDLALFATTELVGAEYQPATTPLHDPTTTNDYLVPTATSNPGSHIGTYAAIGDDREAIDVNPRVLTYYDSETQLVLDANGYNRFPVAGSDGDWPINETLRPGGPNANEGDLRGLVHNSETLYEEIENNSLGPFSDENAYPRARFRMLEAGTSNELRTIQLPAIPGSQTPPGSANEVPLPFYEGFDIVEAGDTIVSDDTDLIPAADDVPSTLTGDEGRQLGPRETIAQGIYGDRFEGLAVANDGTIDVTSIVDDDTLEHSLVVSGVGGIQDDVSDGVEVQSFDSQNRDPNSEAYYLRAAQRLTAFGQAGEPLFPNNAPAIIPFRRPTSISVGDGFGFGLTSNGGSTVSIEVFTDDSANREIYFGEGVSDGSFDGDLARETTCGEAVADAVVLGVDVNLSNDAPQEETLEYGVPTLVDHDSDGDYDEGDTTETQDRGLFVESHDDDGDEFVPGDEGSIVIDTDADDADDDVAGPEDYAPTGSQDVNNTGVVQAIQDWQNGAINNQSIVDIVTAWQGN